MANRTAVVLVRKDAAGYGDYIKYLKPYLDHFGIPYAEMEEYSGEDCAVIIAAHSGVVLSSAAVDAVKGGMGLVCFAPDALPEEFAEASQGGAGTSVIYANAEHYVSNMHSDHERISLYGELSISGAALKASDTLVTCDGIPLVQVSRELKILLWRSFMWASHTVLGPIHGMDDLVWRGIVWAAKKPFAMQGMPAFVGMRVDDVWGAWRGRSPANPTLWIDIAIDHGIKPWLGMFPLNTDEITAKNVRKYVADGNATAFPHALAGCEWVSSPIPENWAHFDHRAGAPHSEEQMAENANYAENWFKENGIPISKYALAHYYETGANALPYFLKWGCEFIGIHMQPSTPYGGGNWLKAGPYRLYEDGEIRSTRPVYYGDYLTVDEAPELSGKLYNCVTEIRDVSGYEWHPGFTTQRTAQRGITHLKRSYQSMVPGVLFTHESAWIQRCSKKMWEDALDIICDRVSEFEPFYWTMDDICAYDRARHDISISDASFDGKLTLTVDGKNDRATMCYVFDEADGEITQKLADIPQTDGKQTVTL